MCPWGDIPLSCLLTSKLDVKSDTIVVHYTFKKGLNKDMNIPPKEIKEFEMVYLFKNNSWTPLNDSELEKIRM